ncbi:MAG: thymidylate synthase [Oscillospiraceae bacterium]|nr:thymidylate synthase [Oscillospiraceae bacterium]
MAYADIVFKEMCRDILENGYDTKGEKVRPIWTDTGEKAYTIKRFAVVNRYDLKKEFPALTLRKTGIKSATDELLWIWQKKSNNIKDLSSHVWDEWADETGSIGSAYGYQIGQKYVHHVLPEGGEDLSSYPSAEIVERNGKQQVMLDQVDGVIYDLKNNPYSRRIMTNIYNYRDLCDMHLYPCAYSMTFNVTKNRETGKMVLNGILNQRSQDVLAANNWNVCQYSVLLHMLAQVCDMEVGEFVHVIADCHIYDRHVDAIRELLSREPFDAPKFWLNPEIKDFYQFTKDDVRLDDYQTGPQITGIPIAV